MSVLSPAFYQRSCVLTIARDLLGKALFTRDERGVITGGLITETEGYAGIDDRASHAYGNRRTPRTEVMYRPGGIAYVYLCYGIHCLLNAVTNIDGIPHAVLIRALRPTHGLDVMLQRRGKRKVDATLAGGPGALCQALGIGRQHNGLPLQGPGIWLEDVGTVVQEADVVAGPRVGVAYAGADALLPYRFIMK